MTGTTFFGERARSVSNSTHTRRRIFQCLHTCVGDICSDDTDTFCVFEKAHILRGQAASTVMDTPAMYGPEYQIGKAQVWTHTIGVLGNNRLMAYVRPLHLNKIRLEGRP